MQAPRNGVFIIAMLLYHSTNKREADCLTTKPAISLPMLLCLRKDSTKSKTITIHQAEIKPKLPYSVMATLQVLEGTAKKSWQSASTNIISWTVIILNSYTLSNDINMTTHLERCLRFAQDVCCAVILQIVGSPHSKARLWHLAKHSLVSHRAEKDWPAHPLPSSSNQKNIIQYEGSK